MTDLTYSRLNFWLTWVFLGLAVFNMRTLWEYLQEDDFPEWWIVLTAAVTFYMLYMMRRCWRDYRKHKPQKMEAVQWNEDML